MVPEPWAANWEVISARDRGVFPFPWALCAGEFWWLFVLKIPTDAFAAGEKSRWPHKCSALATGSSRSFLCHFEPLTLRGLSPLGTWGWDKFQFTASPGHWGWRKAHQEELLTKLKQDNRTGGLDRHPGVGTGKAPAFHLCLNRTYHRECTDLQSDHTVPVPIP